MKKTESILEKETHKFLYDFEIKIDHRIPTRQVFIE